MSLTLNRLISDSQINLSIKDPTTSRYHLIENGKHFLVLSKTEKIGDRFIGMTYKKYSFKDVQQFNNPPESEDTFLRDISKFPLIEQDIEENSTSVNPEPSNYFNCGKMRVSLSKEVQKGISGTRGHDHFVSLDLIKKCIRRKKHYVSRHQQSDLYFFDTQKNRVLNLVTVFEPFDTEKKNLNVLTAYYPTENTLKYRLNGCSEVRLQDWKDKLPKVKLLRSNP